MARKIGSRKLVDIGGNSERLEAALQKFLKRHSIEFERHVHLDGFARYYVNVKDLCCAQAVLGALQQMAEGGSDAK